MNGRWSYYDRRGDLSWSKAKDAASRANTTSLFSEL
jgi:hypothetical protein